MFIFPVWVVAYVGRLPLEVAGLVACSNSVIVLAFFFQAEDGIRDLVRSRGLGDVYKRQVPGGRTSLRSCVLISEF